MSLLKIHGRVGNGYHISQQLLKISNGNQYSFSLAQLSLFISFLPLSIYNICLFHRSIICFNLSNIFSPYRGVLGSLAIIKTFMASWQQKCQIQRTTSISVHATNIQCFLYIYPHLFPYIQYFICVFNSLKFCLIWHLCLL